MKPFMTYYPSTGKWYCREKREMNELMVSSISPFIAYHLWHAAFINGVI